MKTSYPIISSYLKHKRISATLQSNKTIKIIKRFVWFCYYLNNFLSIGPLSSFY